MAPAKKAAEPEFVNEAAKAEYEAAQQAEKDAEAAAKAEAEAHDLAYGEDKTFPRLNDDEVTKRHYQVLDQYRQSLTAGNPLSIEWLAEQLSV